jgi:hypothetical protein
MSRQRLSPWNAEGVVGRMRSALTHLEVRSLAVLPAV